MVDRALPIRRPQIARDEKFVADERPGERTAIGALARRFLRLLRLLGEFVAAGGPLS